MNYAKLDLDIKWRIVVWEWEKFLKNFPEAAETLKELYELASITDIFKYYKTSPKTLKLMFWERRNTNRRMSLSKRAEMEMKLWIRKIKHLREEPKIEKRLWETDEMFYIRYNTTKEENLALYNKKLSKIINKYNRKKQLK